MNTSLEDGVVSADPVVDVVLGSFGTALRAQRDDQCEGELRTKDKGRYSLYKLFRGFHTYRVTMTV